jgi:RNA polymerase sigma-70 factor (ECF subfamily)
MPAGVLELKELAPRTPASIVRLLVANYREFSSFLEEQVGSRVVSAEILQDAFVRGMHKLDLVHSDESTVDWFYRLLRHAVIDQPRPSGQLDPKLMSFRAELEQKLQPSVALSAAIHRCISGLAATLDPEQFALLGSADAYVGDGPPLAEASEVSERVSSARAALRRQIVSACGTCAVHGSWNCTCGSALARYGQPG